MDKFSILLAIIVFILIIAIIFLYVKDTKEEEIEAESDLLYHTSVNKTQEWASYFNSLREKDPSIISGYDLVDGLVSGLLYSIYGVHDSYISFSGLNQKTSNSQHLSQAYISNISPLMGYMLKRSKFYSLDEFASGYTCNQGKMFVQKFKHYKTGREFYFSTIILNWPGAFIYQDSYQTLMSLFNKLKEIAQDTSFMIVGDFKVHGWEAVADFVFGSNTIYRPDLYKLMTCDDNDGAASPDGFICSRNLCSRIEWWIERPNMEVHQHFALVVKIYWTGIKKGIKQKPIADQSILNRIKYIVDNNNDGLVNLIGNPGEFDNTKPLLPVDDWNFKDEFYTKIQESYSFQPTKIQTILQYSLELTEDKITITPPLFITRNKQISLLTERIFKNVPDGFKFLIELQTRETIGNYEINQVDIQYDDGNVFNKDQEPFQMYLWLDETFYLLNCTIKSSTPTPDTNK